MIACYTCGFFSYFIFLLFIFCEKGYEYEVRVDASNDSNKKISKYLVVKENWTCLSSYALLASKHELDYQFLLTRSSNLL